MTEEDWYQAAIRDYEIEEIPYSELNADKKKKIGQGGFSKIYETNHETKGTLAIKKIVKNEVYKVFNRELKVHSQIEHKRIIRFHGISRDEQQGYYFVLELANQGNLREFTEKNKDNDNFNWEERHRLACQIAEGLCYLHEKDIAHCDLHTKNILINDGDIKISDFGLSKDLNSAIGSSNNKIFGIIPFIDPQKFHDSKFVLDKTSDIYSLGVVLWEISSCRTPFLKELYNWDLVYKIRNGKREKPVKGTPIQYKQIYTDCWQFKSDSRPSIDNVLSRLQSMSIEREQVIEEDNGNSSDDTSGNPDTGYDYPTISDMTIPDRVSAFLHNGTSGNKDSQPNPDSVSETLGNNPTVCKNCGKFKHHYWCRECEAKAFQKDQNWTSGNKDLDELIKNSQLNVKNHKYFVWINYDQLRNIEPTAQGSCCEKKFYTATWLNGIRGWNDSSQEWTRSGPVKIILQKFKLESTIKNLELHLKIENVIDCYGFTQDSNTNYYMVLKYVNGGNLRNYVWNNYPLSWFKRLLILKKIVRIISKIHDAKYIHRDLYPGNILIQEADGWDEIELDVYISELDSCANLDSKIEQQQYGNLLYIAPEVIVSSGNETSIKSDVYSIGMIMWELASGDEPYSNRGTDKDELIRDIINGAHPNDVIETPECYRELMQKCLNVDPEKRPITSDLLDMLLTFTEVPLKKQFEVANRRIRGQGSKDNNKITKGQSYPEFRFTNQPLSKIFSDAQEIEERMEDIKIDN